MSHKMTQIIYAESFRIWEPITVSAYSVASSQKITLGSAITSARCPWRFIINFDFN